MHQKVIKGKPYYYTTVREGSKTRTIYLGSRKKEALRKERELKGIKPFPYQFLVGGILLLVFCGLMAFSSFTLTGMTVSEGIPAEVVETEASATEEVVDTGNDGEEAVEEVNTQPVEEEQESVEEAPEEESSEASNSSESSAPALNDTVSDLPSNESLSENESIVSNPAINSSLSNVTIQNTSVSNESSSNESVGDSDFSLRGESNASVSLNVSNASLALNQSLNVSVTNVTFGNVSATEEVVQYGAVVGQPVRWEKRVKLDAEVTDVQIELPPLAENISLTEFVNGSETDIDLSEVKVEENGRLKDIRYTDLVEKDAVSLGFFQGLFRWTGFELITGFAVAENITLDDNVTLVVEEAVEDVIVEYYTEAPVAIESFIPSGKRVVVSSETHYENILSYSSVPDAPLSEIQLYWYPNGTNESKQVFPFDAYDLNNNGLVDYIEWVTPHLSNQTFEIAMTIITVQSYPTVGGNWTVLFNTTGSANLTIQASNGTYWDTNSTDSSVYDLRFLEVQCGNTTQNEVWTDTVENNRSNGYVLFENYSCANTSMEIANVLTGGVHTIQFSFGNLTKYAYNDAASPPKVTSVNYSGPVFYNSSFYIIAGVTDAEGVDDISSVNFTVNSSSGKYLLRNDAGTHQGSGIYHSPTFTINSTDYYNYTILAYDITNGINTSNGTLDFVYVDFTLTPNVAGSGEDVKVEGILNYTNKSGLENISFSLYYNESKEFGDWLNSTWKKRTNISVEEKSGESLNFHVIPLQIDTKSLISADVLDAGCTGMYFANSSGAHIPHWIQNGCNTALTNVTIRVSGTGSNLAQTVYMYIDTGSILNRSGENNTVVIRNPSFEEARAWEYNESLSNYENDGYMNFWSSDLDTAYRIRIPGSGTSGNYGQISQEVNLTDVDRIYFDLRVTGDNNGASQVRHQVLVDSTLLYDRDEPTSDDATLYNLSIDVSGYSGLHMLRFRLNNDASLGGAERNMTIDNVRIHNVSSPVLTYGSVQNILETNSSGDLNNTITIVGTNGNTYNVTVNVSENGLYGQLVKTLTLTSAKPTQGAPIINSSSGTNVTTDNITVFNVSTSDTDGDRVKNIYQWYVDLEPFAVLNMPFEGGSNATWTKDYSSYGNDGVVASGAVWNSTQGYDGFGFYNFSGNNVGYINLTNSNLNTFTTWSGFTLTAWVKTEDNTQSNTIMSQISGSGTGRGILGVHAPQCPNEFYSILSGNALCSTSTVSNDQWIHVALRYNGTSLSVFVNGVEENQSVATINENADGHLLIGIHNNFNAGSAMRGDIDELLMFNRSLSSAQIYMIYSNSTNKIASAETAPIEQWTAQVIPNDGTVNGNGANVSLGVHQYTNCPDVSGNVTISSDTVWDVSYVCNTVHVTSNSWLYFNSTAAGNKSINLTANTLTIDGGSYVSTYLLGYMNGFGPGRATNNNLGGAYGGDGGDGNRRPPIGRPYGNILAPTESGSPGHGAGSRGAGAIHLNISGVLTVNGIIDLNGSRVGNMGGGSGGGLLINTTNLTGSGTIRADGGRADAGSRGAGSGGRIAIYYANNDFTGNISVKGGDSNTNGYEGGAGTLFMKNRTQEYGELIIQNDNRNNNLEDLPQTEINTTFLNGQTTFDKITIANHSWVPINANLTILNTELFIENRSTLNHTEGIISFPLLENLTIAGTLSLVNNYTFNSSMNVVMLENGFLTHKENNGTQLYILNLSVNNFTMLAGSYVDVTGDGYRGEHGPGGTTSSQVGGSYGGRGGRVSNTLNSKPTYGSVTEPLDLGSGGEGSNLVGYGGGAIFLNVSDTLVVHGTISANSSAEGNTGTGSGGSVYLLAKNISGNGVISADAGRATTSSRSGGGGGRIAIYYNTSSFNGNISAKGADASTANLEGGAGTIYLKDKDEDFGEVIIKNNNALAGFTIINASQLNVTALNNLTVANGSNLQLLAPLTIHNKALRLNNRSTLNVSNYLATPLLENLTVYRSNQFLQHGNWTAPNLTLMHIGGNISLSNNYTVNTSLIITLEPHSLLTHRNNIDESVYLINLTVRNLTVAGNGFVITRTRGYDGTYGPGDGGADARGAGYGGAGGNIAATSTGQPYGSLTAPKEIGSAGGSSDGAPGGGLVILNVTDTLTVDGRIDVNGTRKGNEGGGSGGSLYIITKKLAGSGVLSVQGGVASTGGRSGGGGGRLALYYNATTFTGNILKEGGTGGSAGYNGKNASHFNCNYGPASCSGSFGSEARSSSGGILVKSNYSLNASQDINKTINVTWTKSAINWTDESNGSVTGTYAISGLRKSAPYLIFDNGVFNRSLNSTADGELEAFSILLSSPHSISVGTSDTNDPPSISGTVINTTNIQNYTNGTINLNYSTSDPDGDSVTVSITWFVNEAINTTFDNLITIGSGNTSKGENWTAELSPFDGTERGSNTTATVMITNSPPTVSGVVINTTDLNNYTNGTINLNYSASDPDVVDSLTTTIDWIVNNNFNTTYANLNQVDSGNTTRGDNWTAVISSSDGASRFNATTSVIIQNSPIYMGAIVSPETNALINNTLNVTWETAIDGDSSETWYYNVSLLNPDNTLNQTLANNLAQTLTNFSYNVSTLTNGVYKVNVTVAESASTERYVSSSTTGNITINHNKVNISLVSPLEGSGNTDGSIRFEANVTNTTLLTQCDLILNNVINKTTTNLGSNIINFTVSNLNSGTHTWKVNCSDGISNFTSSVSRTAYELVLPTEYTNATTNFSNSVLTNVNLVLDVPTEAMVNYTTAVNVAGVNLSACTNLSNNRIEVDSSGCSVLNAGARLTLRGLSFTDPQPLKDGVLCGTGEGCTEISYSGGEYVYAVNGFTVYSSQETPVASSGSSSSSSSSSSGGSTSEGKSSGGGFFAPSYYDPENFSLSHDEFTFDLAYEESKEEVLTITNELGKAQFFTLDVVSIDDVFSPSDVSFTLEAGESKNVSLYAVSDREPGVHVGSLLVITEQETKALPIVVEISSVPVLFDATVFIPKDSREVKPGGTLNTEISLLNVGAPRKVDVLMLYTIKDLSGNVVLEDSETISVDSEKSFSKEFFLPNTVAEGSYVLGLEVIYVNSVAVSSSSFAVIDKGIFSSAGFIALLIIIPVLLALLVVGFVVVFKRKGS